MIDSQHVLNFVGVLIILSVPIALWTMCWTIYNIIKIKAASHVQDEDSYLESFDKNVFLIVSTDVWHSRFIQNYKIVPGSYVPNKDSVNIGIIASEEDAILSCKSLNKKFSSEHRIHFYIELDVLRLV